MSVWRQVVGVLVGMAWGFLLSFGTRRYPRQDFNDGIGSLECKSVQRFLVYAESDSKLTILKIPSIKGCSNYSGDGRHELSELDLHSPLNPRNLIESSAMAWDENQFEDSIVTIITMPL